MQHSYTNRLGVGIQTFAEKFLVYQGMTDQYLHYCAKENLYGFESKSTQMHTFNQKTYNVMFALVWHSYAKQIVYRKDQTEQPMQSDFDLKGL